MADVMKNPTVEMEDGRIVDFPGKRKMNKSSSVDAVGTISLRMDFRNGKTVNFLCPDSLKDKAAMHGLEQKFGDETAGLDDIEDAVLAVEQLAERLSAGTWSMKREGGSGFAGTSILARALVEKTGKPIGDIKAWLKTKTQAEKVALRNNPSVKPIIERLEGERVAKSSNVNTEELLGELA